MDTFCSCNGRYELLEEEPANLACDPAQNCTLTTLIYPFSEGAKLEKWCHYKLIFSWKLV